MVKAVPQGAQRAYTIELIPLSVAEKAGQKSQCTLEIKDTENQCGLFHRKAGFNPGCNVVLVILCLYLSGNICFPVNDFFFFLFSKDNLF